MMQDPIDEIFVKETQKELAKNEQNLPRKYTRTHLILSLVDFGITFAYFLVLIFAGGSFRLGHAAQAVTSAVYGKLIVFVLLAGLGNSILLFPVEFYSGFILEHKYGLSNQTIPQWLWEGVKGTLVGLVIFIPLIAVLYYFLHQFQVWWWVPVGFIIFFFSILMARVAPVLIFPLFYKFKPVQDENLKHKILSLCDRAGVKVSNILAFNLSKTTKKANAAFTGMGKTRRIILGDTLIDNFSADEIEVVFAHELGHYKKGHIRKGILLGFFMIFTGLFVTSVFYRWTIPALGYKAVDQIEALPLFFLLFIIFNLVVMPIQNSISRKHEVQADTYALDITQKPEAFISSMEKLSKINLSDKEPNPAIEFLFYSHPSIKKRIALAKQRMNEV